MTLTGFSCPVACRNEPSFTALVSSTLWSAASIVQANSPGSSVTVVVMVCCPSVGGGVVDAVKPTALKVSSVRFVIAHPWAQNVPMP